MGRLGQSPGPRNNDLHLIRNTSVLSLQSTHLQQDIPPVAAIDRDIKNQINLVLFVEEEKKRNNTNCIVEWHSERLKYNNKKYFLLHKSIV